MRFEKLTVMNFASYYGEHVVDLNCTDDKPVVIFLGGTGFGKTTLFDALNWALYGVDYEKDLLIHRQRKIEDYVNESALQEASLLGNTVPMSCTLHFEYEGNSYYIKCSRFSRGEKYYSELPYNRRGNFRR